MIFWWQNAKWKFLSSFLVARPLFSVILKFSRLREKKSRGPEKGRVDPVDSDLIQCNWNSFKCNSCRQWRKMSFPPHVIIFEEYVLPQEDFKCIYIQFIFEFFKKTIFLAKNGKIFFAANTLNIMNSSPLVNSPRIVLSIPAFNLRKKNRRRNPIYGFWSKKFFHRNSLKCLICNPQRFFRGRPSVSHEIVDCQGGVTRSTPVWY